MVRRHEHGTTTCTIVAYSTRQPRRRRIRHYRKMPQDHDTVGFCKLTAYNALTLSHIMGPIPLYSAILVPFMLDSGLLPTITYLLVQRFVNPQFRPVTFVRSAQCSLSYSGQGSRFSLIPVPSCSTSSHTNREVLRSFTS